MTKSELMVKVSSVCYRDEDPMDIIKVAEFMWDEAFSKLSEDDQIYLWNGLLYDLEKEAGLGLPPVGQMVGRAVQAGKRALGLSKPAAGAVTKVRKGGSAVVGNTTEDMATALIERMKRKGTYLGKMEGTTRAITARKPIKSRYTSGDF